MYGWSRSSGTPSAASVTVIDVWLANGWTMMLWWVGSTWCTIQLEAACMPLGRQPRGRSQRQGSYWFFDAGRGGGGAGLPVGPLWPAPIGCLPWLVSFESRGSI